MNIPRRSSLVCLLVLLQACTVTVVPPSGPPAGGASPTTGTQEAAPTSGATLPFKTVAFDDGGVGRYFAAGTTETVVLDSKADLDAFTARHKPAVPPVFGPP